MPAEQESSADQARRGVRDWVREAGRRTGTGLRHVTPYGILALLAGAAAAPVVGAGLGTTGALAAALDQIGGMGSSYLADVLATTAHRMRGRNPSEVEWRTAIAEELKPLLAEADERSQGLRDDIGQLLRATGAVEVALAASSEAGEQFQAELLTAFQELGTDIGEMRWLLAATHRATQDLQRDLAGQSHQQRLQYEELKRRLIVATMIRTYASPQASPPAGKDSGEREYEICPYPGLASFQPEDAAWFLGRDAQVADLVGRLAEQLVGGPPLLMTGVSGVGKSSLLRAGLLPALAAGALGDDVAGWPWVLMTPGATPLRELVTRTAHLAGLAEADIDELASLVWKAPERFGDLVAAAVPSGQPVIVVDQLEELFTLCRDPAERLAFATAVTHAAPAVIATALRADFYPACAQLAPMARLLAAEHVVLGPLDVGDLRQAIEEPARRAGLVVEPGVIELLLAELGTADPEGYPPGALPLLGHVLRATWRHREGNRLTVAAYQATGGIRRAVPETAERIYLSLDPTGRAALRSGLLGLVATVDDTRVVRRRGSPESLDHQVRARLVEARLVTASENAIEISHEALLTEWPRLAGWLAEDREELLLRQRLSAAAVDWSGAGRDPDLLIRGSRLEAMRERSAAWVGLSQDEADYLAASFAASEAAERARWRTVRRLRRLTAGLVAALLLAFSGGLVALDRQATANEQRRVAERQADIALSRYLAGQSDALAGSDARLSMLLSVAAWRTAQTDEARGAALAQAGRWRTVRGFLPDPDGERIYSAAIAPDGETLATIRLDGTVVMWDVADRRVRRTIQTGVEGPVDVRFSPDSTRIAVGGDGGLGLWSTRTGDPVATLVPADDPGTVHSLAFYSDSLLAAGDDWGQIVVWDLATQEPHVRLDGMQGAVTGLAIPPDESFLAAAASDGTLTMWQLDEEGTPERDEAVFVRDFPVATGHESVPLAVSQDGQWLAAGGNSDGVGTTLVWEVASGDLVHTLPGDGSGIGALMFIGSPAVMLVTGADSAEVRYWSVDSGQLLRTFQGQGHTGQVNALFGHPTDPLLVYSAAGGGNVIERNLRGDSLSRPGGKVQAMVLTPDGNLLISGGTDGTLSILVLADPEAEERHTEVPGGAAINDIAVNSAGRDFAFATEDDVWLDPLDGPARTLADAPTRPTSAAFHPDDTRVAAVGRSGGIVLWDLTDDTSTVLGDPVGNYASIAFSPDGGVLAAGSLSNDGIRLWDPDTGRHLGNLPDHANTAVGLAFSPDGRTLVSAGLDGRVIIWDVARRQPMRVLAGHAIAATSVAFTPDGRMIITGDLDGTIILWDAAQGQRLAQLPRPSDSIRDLAVTPDGRTVLAAYFESGEVAAWTIDVDRALTQLCAVAGRTLSPEEISHYLVPAHAATACDPASR